MLPRFESASQTAGPYVHIGLVPSRAGIEQSPLVSHDLCLQGVPASALAIEISGQVLDGSGSPVQDAVVEIWQADHCGTYHPSTMSGFRGWGRSAIDQDNGRYFFRTIKPGSVVCRDGVSMAPHLAFWIVARGINIGLNTRMYFPEDSDLHQADPVLNTIEIKMRRTTLIAGRADDPASESASRKYHFDIVLQGERETVFFDI
jgi:protocatechuate 3,4-dioxygenase alpha subunit